VKITDCEIPEVKLIEPTVFEDERGFFLEAFHIDKFKDAGIEHHFVQDNHSRSVQYTLRGLHFQLPPFAQAKLVRATRGRIFDVAVDIRPHSPTYKQWVGVELSEDNKKMLLVPADFAHGFVVLSETAELQYKCSNVYSKDHERGLRWDDPAFNIDWQLPDDVAFVLSEKDKQAPTLAEYQNNEI
jgi:dTDP-4-dehydrorhamnose 3,5-epimerase